MSIKAIACISGSTAVFIEILSPYIHIAEFAHIMVLYHYTLGNTGRT